MKRVAGSVSPVDCGVSCQLPGLAPSSDASSAVSLASVESKSVFGNVTRAYRHFVGARPWPREIVRRRFVVIEKGNPAELELQRTRTLARTPVLGQMRRSPPGASGRGSHIKGGDECELAKDSACPDDLNHMPIGARRAHGTQRLPCHVQGDGWSPQPCVPGQARKQPGLRGKLVIGTRRVRRCLQEREKLFWECRLGTSDC